MKLSFKIVFVFITFTYISVCIYLYSFQEKLIFKTHMSKKPISLYQSNMNIQNITYKTSDNTILYGKYKFNSQNLPLIIFFDGSSNDSTRIFNILPNIEKYNLLTFNYRGYGLSQGEPSQQQILNDALKIFDKFHTTDTILIGRSLGASVASYVASKRNIKGLILLAPFDSISALAQKKYPILPIKLLLKHTFETTQFLKNMTSPTIIFEIINDEIVPKENFKRVKNTIQHLVKHEKIFDSNHTNFIMQETFQKKLLDSLKILSKK